MDPLTHTLVGANLASTRLGEKSRFATAALVIGANLPDVDSILYFTGHDDLALGFRRGWTHGILALVVLPVMLAVILLAWDRLRPHPLRKAAGLPLPGLSALAVLTHPFLDWLNNYGMRWLMPFSGTWSYGDSVFIMDPWLWLALGGGWLAARRATRGRLLAWAFFAACIAWVAGSRATEYLIPVGIVAFVLLLALLWRPKDEQRSRRAFAAAALAVAALYIGARLTIHAVTTREVIAQLERSGVGTIDRIMVAPHPLDPRRWNVVAQAGDFYHWGDFTWSDGAMAIGGPAIPVAKPSPELEAASRDPGVQGFLTWVRFLAYEVERRGNETRVHLRDARYAPRRGGGFGGRVVVLP